jgi:hypothetical protein
VFFQVINHTGVENIGLLNVVGNIDRQEEVLQYGLNLPDDCSFKKFDSQLYFWVTVCHFGQQFLQLHGCLHGVDLECKQRFLFFSWKEIVFNNVQNFFHLLVGDFTA